jgi:hypothetical protein
MNRIRSLVLVVLATALMSAGALAQVTPPPAGEPAAPVVTPAPTTTTPPPAETTVVVPRDDGFDWGWIGLLGLLGLAGLTRREARPVERVAAYPAPRPDETTTPRGGAR